MAKHAVPKRKAPKSQTSSRHKAFVFRSRQYLIGKIHLTKCPNCGEKCLLHYVCPHCGMYRGRQIVNVAKKAEKITKIKV